MKNFDTAIRIVFIGLCLILLCCSVGCESSKQSLKSKQDIEQTTQENTQNDIKTQSKKTTERTVEGGTISGDIIPLKDRERDDSGDLKELIQEIKEGGLTKTVYYRPDGTVNVECKLAEMFERIQEENIKTDNSIIARLDTLDQQIKEKDKLKETEFKDTAIWAGLIVLLGGQFFTFIFLNKRIPKSPL